MSGQTDKQTDRYTQTCVQMFTVFSSFFRAHAPQRDAKMDLSDWPGTAGDGAATPRRRHLPNLSAGVTEFAIFDGAVRQSVRRRCCPVRNRATTAICRLLSYLAAKTAVLFPFAVYSLYKSRLPQTDPHDALRYTKLDAPCDKLATDDRRQFITLGVHLS